MNDGQPPEDAGRQPLETREKWIDAQELRMAYEAAAAGLGLDWKLTVKSWRCAGETGFQRVYGVFIVAGEP